MVIHKSIYLSEEEERQLDIALKGNCSSSNMKRLLMERVKEVNKTNIKELEQQAANALNEYASSILQIKNLQRQKIDDEKITEIRTKNEEHAKKKEKFLEDFHGCPTTQLKLELMQAYLSNPHYESLVPEITLIYERMKNG